MGPVNAGDDREALLGLDLAVDHVEGLHDVEDPADAGARRGLRDPSAVYQLLKDDGHPPLAARLPRVGGRVLAQR